jgi:hypothetical protein
MMRLIKKMPDKETLEAYLEGSHGSVKVVFNLLKGVFEWVVPHNVKKKTS